MTSHEPRLVRHEVKPRLLEVTAVSALSPRMVRVTLGGPELAGFPYAAPQDHVKIALPATAREHRSVARSGSSAEPAEASGPATGSDEPIMPSRGARPILRAYTVRYYRPETNEIDIDFLLHGDGPASNWAAQAKPGQRLGVLGPRGSVVVPYDFDWYLFAGDEAALPAVGAWLEQVPAGARVFAFAEVADQSAELRLESLADLRLEWLHRDRGDTLDAAVSAFEPPAGAGYLWVAGESGAMRRVRRHLREAGQRWFHVDGYWRRGVAGHDHHQSGDGG